MGTITTRDGTEIFYKDWGSGRPVVFSHGWPLTADAWDDQLFLVASNGYRAIAHDRRGGGRSGQPWNGNDLDTYANRPGNTVSQGLRDSFWLLSMTVGVKGAYDCIKAFSETDLTEDLKKIDVPTLIIHGDDDQIVPIGAAALQSSKIVKDATLKVYPGAPHGLAQTTAYKDTFNTDLLSFINV
jgi:pimeloyl-ACP methyl ester carboxylesterase